MLSWAILAFGSMLVGVYAVFKVKARYTFWVAGIVPCLVAGVVLLSGTLLTPQLTKSAVLGPADFLVAGIAAAAFGVISACAINTLRQIFNDPPRS